MKTLSLWKSRLSTLAIGGLGASVLSALAVPVAPLVGAALSMAVASILGVRSDIPGLARHVALLFVGISIGASITADALDAIVGGVASFSVLAATSLLTLLVGTNLIGRIGFRGVDGLLGSVPGHLSFIAANAAELTSNAPVIVAMQSLRAISLALAVPGIVVVLNNEITRPDNQSAALTVLPYEAVLLTMISGIAAGRVLSLLHVPSAYLFVGIAISGFGQTTELAQGVLHPVVIWIALATIGSIVGSRFAQFDRSTVVASLSAGAVLTVLSAGFAAMGAYVATLTFDMSFTTLLLAYAPGGVEAMIAISVALGIDPAFVSAHHVFRLVLLPISTQIGLWLLARSASK